MLSHNESTLFLHKTESWDILERMLRKAQRADEVTVCSFAMAEGFARRLLKEKQNNSIRRLTVLLDFTVATRNRAQLLFIAGIADELYLTHTHAKLLVVQSHSYKAVCCLSANATLNHRYECGIVSCEPLLLDSAQQQLETMKKESVRIEANTGDRGVCLPLPDG